MNNAVESDDKNVAADQDEKDYDSYRPDERVEDEISDKQAKEEEEKYAKRLSQPNTHVLEFMQEIAVSRGGKCLSTVYKGLSEHLEWECCDGHTWNATPRNVLHRKSWCPKCRGNVGEEIVRAVLIEAFPGKTFERTRREPWLNGLELDGYNSELKLAFEYQGIQHFEHVPHFHRKPGAFESQLARDASKQLYCAEQGVRLLRISYKEKLEELRDVVRKMLVDAGFTIAEATMDREAFYNTCRAGSHNNSRLELARKIAIEKGGVCLASKYISYGFKMPFTCGFGHDFQASLWDINQKESRGPRFCPVCGGTQKKSDDEIRSRVEAIGYIFLATYSKKSGNRNRRYLTVQCPNKDHKPYDVIMDNLISKNGSLRKGCSACHHAELGASKRLDIDEWTKKTGIAIIGTYTARNKSYQWKCSRNHTFEARLDSLQGKKDPCSACWLLDYAEERNFEILSEVRGDVSKGDALKWRCLECNEFVIEASRVSVSKKDLVCKACE